MDELYHIGFPEDEIKSHLTTFLESIKNPNQSGKEIKLESGTYRLK